MGAVLEAFIRLKGSQIKGSATPACQQQLHQHVAIQLLLLLLLLLMLAEVASGKLLSTAADADAPASAYVLSLHTQVVAGSGHLHPDAAVVSCLAAPDEQHREPAAWHNTILDKAHSLAQRNLWCNTTRGPTACLHAYRTSRRTSSRSVSPNQGMVPESSRHPLCTSPTASSGVCQPVTVFQCGYLQVNGRSHI